jgi:peptidoglycan lytic transglycosylase
MGRPGGARFSGLEFMRLPLRPVTVGAVGLLAVIILNACSRGSGSARYGASAAVSPRVVSTGQPVPKGGGRYKIGDPYQVDGQWFTPREEASYDRTGVSSYYSQDFHGRRTANGEVFDMWALSAAHPTLPLPSYVYVTNLSNGRTLLLRVNDRGPYAKDRVIDVSLAAARYLGFETRGTSTVRVRYAGQAPISGDDRCEQRFLANQPWFRVALSHAP